jgi:chromosomal replication initiation ATPase DnaA
MYLELRAESRPIRTPLSAIIMRRRCIWDAAKAIIAEVAAKHDVSIVELLEKNRRQPVVKARREAMYRIRVGTPVSMPRLGQWFDMDHSSAMYAIDAHAIQNDLKPLFRKGFGKALNIYRKGK